MSTDASKIDRYREAFRELGLDVNLATFGDHCRAKYGFDVNQSTFYALRKELRDEAAAGGPGEGPPAVAVADLPALLAEARTLLGRFGGNKEALIRFIAQV